MGRNNNTDEEEEEEHFSFDQFPPFYTLQPNLTVRKRQIALWRDRVLKICREQRLSYLNIHSGQQEEEQQERRVFGNEHIHRQLDIEGIRAVLNDLVLTDNGRWCDASQTRFMVLWHTPAEWSQIIYDWVINTGKLGSVETVFSIHSGEDAIGTEFYGLPPEVIMLALDKLDLSGKCEIFKGNTTDATGVKFFTSNAL
ncbi:Vacuolar protein sorting protein, putative [Perkinsus marinus ATCC 50983]|uniref:Vacuolar protein sorting protein, putative n=1 Tax=Perkinsus marinus (strain ATCC 50983 / TXsc) TaxID=423536 RepID=C5LCU8_PERM5|nr:Vacuolar protein sorting protein, putative [Perkinsus marinus ATCC 50983]EER05451.1 Vacuolar protein sorting protein, putative [Perkinsus marinus ATCC 50983]|eukprot:XP_002773635.1 Vacuolar protein sorting protein, putative [Perkinsus marinus ATCC 50983]